MASNSENSGFETFRLFSTSDEKPNLGFGFLDSSEPLPPSPPKPPCVKVLPSGLLSSVKYTAEPLNLDGLTFLKGRVSTQEVFALGNSDLVPGKYEGGLKLWEGSLDLIKALRSERQNGQLSFAGKRVLELGCGHGLPGIFACLEGASVVHFQDFNAEVLQCLTIPNVNANVPKKFLPNGTKETNRDTVDEVSFFAGDWSEIHQLLAHVHDNKKDQNSFAGYDIILMAETVYSISALQDLYELIKKCMSSPHGVVYMAAKKHYFGVGGGTRRFLAVVEKDGAGRKQVLTMFLVMCTAIPSSSPSLDPEVLVYCLMIRFLKGSKVVTRRAKALKYTHRRRG